MNIYTPTENTVTQAFMKVSNIFYDFVQVEDRSSTEVFLLDGVASLRQEYRDDVFFIVLFRLNDKKMDDVPINVLFINPVYLAENIGNFQRRYRAWKNKRSKDLLSPQVIPEDLESFEQRYKVLVIDDSRDNLVLASVVLTGHDIVLVSGPAAAIDELDAPGQAFDAVLTDMQMRPDRLYGLNLDNYDINQTIPSGFMVIFEATSRGLPVAVVTDANHHSDWVSAMFDYVDAATVNDQKVLFFNHIGKRWDQALKSLLELEA